MSENKPVFVISDLHMGDRGARDNFAVGNKETELNLLLEFVEKENGELVIVGDLFEFWQASLGKVLVNRMGLIDRLADMEATFVVGNHDIDLEALIGIDLVGHRFFKKMTRRFVREIAGKRFVFMHGHEVDPYNKGDSPGWSRIAAIFAGICEDFNRSPVLDTGEFFESWLFKIVKRLWNWVRMRFVFVSDKRQLTPAQNPKLVKKMLHRYKEDKIKEGYDIGIVGHTHKAGRFEDWYFNSGCWAEATNSFLRISDDGNVEVFDWENGKAIPNETVLLA
jgi:UDP-2,3-diacylglucosamine pyrophosphatase LpxH